MLMVASEALIGDYEYSDLFLWLVDQLVGQFRDEFEAPLDQDLVKDTEDWFAGVTEQATKSVKSELAVETEAEAGAKFGWFGVGLKMVARLKSMLVGSVEHRETIRRELQRYSFDLVNRVNLLLDDAHRALKEAGRPANLLIVVDNLDRLRHEVGRRLFQENGDQLKQLRAHVIYTVPIASVLAPMNVGRVFEHRFTLPMVQVRKPDGGRSERGIGVLLRVLDERLDCDSVFTSRTVARLLARMSGGSVRDLIRLVSSARLVAVAQGKGKIDRSSAMHAITKLRIEYKQILIPGQVYYPMLVKVHETHQDWFEDAETASADRVAEHRGFFNELLSSGAVSEYDGGDSWYDVHPVIEDIDAFKKALSHVETSAESDAQ